LDNVSQPSHYKGRIDSVTKAVRLAVLSEIPHSLENTNIECLEAMISTLNVEELRGYLRGNSFKYRWRYRTKNGIEDLRKAHRYEQMLMRLEEASEKALIEEAKLMRPAPPATPRPAPLPPTALPKTY